MQFVLVLYMWDNSPRDGLYQVMALVVLFPDLFYSLGMRLHLVSYKHNSDKVLVHVQQTRNVCVCVCVCVWGGGGGGGGGGGAGAELGLYNHL